MSAKIARWLRVIPVLVLTLVLVGIVALRAHAQDDTQQVEIVGAIQAVENQTTLTINNLTVDASQAETTLVLEIGLVVKVEGELQADGTILAREIKLPDQGIMADEMELVGMLNSLDPATAVVGGLTFDVTGAEIEADLAVGDLVEVHAMQAEGGAWIAREIKRFVSESTSGTGDESAEGEMEAEDFEIVGTLEELGAGYVVVSGQTISTEGAEMQDPLVVGALVKVEGNFAGDALVATEVKPAVASDLGQTVGNDVCGFEVEVSSGNLRSGPGTGYSVVGYALQSDKFPVLETSGSGDWIKVQTSQGEAWIAASLGKFENDCSALPVSGEPEVVDDNSNDNSIDDNGNDNSIDDNGNDNGVDDNGNDNSIDDNGNANGNDNSGGHGGDDNGNDNGG